MSPEVVIAIPVAIAVIIAAWQLWRFSRRSSSSPALVEAAPAFPESGVLVSEELLRAAGTDPEAIWGALETAVAPIAVEYFPVTDVELSKLRTAPVVNATAQQAMIDLIKKVDPKSPTLFRAVLPEGAKLVKAAGAAGFRGFSRTGGKTAHAVLKPVAVGGAVVAGWPALAVAGTVMMVDMVAQREQRLHQRRVTSLLNRQEERHYRTRISAQRVADDALSTAISLMLDGREPAMELAVDSANIEFHLSRLFLEKYAGVIDALADDQGKVDYRKLELALGGAEKDIDNFVREFHLASAAVAIKRKALVAYAASFALADRENPYAALREVFKSQAKQLEETEVALAQLNSNLGNVALKGRWHDRIVDRVRSSDRSVAAREDRFHAEFAELPKAEGDAELTFIMTPTGDLLQVLPAEDDLMKLDSSEPPVSGDR
ncbi:hypothetical protein [Microbacterium sp. 4-7]|uniref:hypothetical protein n=1 Tax=Microbacterium sp. 4-7 TaxID=1885327 RepID=UPI00164F14C5|nr:hypothetical protein [Microbacterium sp. 4-7]MBC6495130.1 hypothetical protein [Microbacterium sp. 4-7]